VVHTHVSPAYQAAYDERDDSSSSDDSDSGTDSESDSEDSDDEGKVVYPSHHFGHYGVLELAD
jgi:hypothetical protein